MKYNKIKVEDDHNLVIRPHTYDQHILTINEDEFMDTLAGKKVVCSTKIFNKNFEWQVKLLRRK